MGGRASRRTAASRRCTKRCDPRPRSTWKRRSRASAGSSSRKPSRKPFPTPSGTVRAQYRHVLFEVEPEETARRVSEALFAAESGDPAAIRWLNESALVRLRADADRLVDMVPYAFLRLTEQ